MMTASIHGEVKARLYQRILLDRVFTVADLSANSGLRPEQIYPLLAKLRRSGYLSAESVGESKKRPHRPNLLYTLSEELEKRKQLADEIKPFLQLESETKAESRGLQELQRNLLRWISRFQRMPALSEKFSLAHLTKIGSFIDQLELSASELKNDLEVAWYECHGPADKSLVDDFEAAKSIFQKTLAEIGRRKEQLEAQQAELNAENQFSQILAAKIGEDGLAACTFPKLFRLLETEYRQHDSFYLRTILSSLSARARYAVYPGAVLVEAAIRFGAAPNLPLEWLRTIISSGDRDVVMAYNFVNSCLLAKQESEAFEAWKAVVVRQKELLTTLGSLKQLSIYRGTILETGDVSSLGEEQLAELTTRVGAHGGLSMVSVSPVDAFGAAPYVIKPTFADLCEPESAGFVLSASLRSEHDNLHSYGPLTDIVQFPGLPRVRLAIALVRLGVNVETAWRVAENLRAGKVILLLHIPKAADGSTSGNLQQPLAGFQFEGLFDNPEQPKSTAAA